MKARPNAAVQRMMVRNSVSRCATSKISAKKNIMDAFSFCPLPWAAGVVCLAAGIGSLCGAARQGVRPGVHACFACQRASRAAQMIRRVRGESSKKCLFMCISPVRCIRLALHCTVPPAVATLYHGTRQIVKPCTVQSTFCTKPVLCFCAIWHCTGRWQG